MARSAEELRGYQRGYQRGIQRRWPNPYALAELPDEQVEELAQAALALADAVDSYFACMDPEERDEPRFGKPMSDAEERVVAALKAIAPRFPSEPTK